MPQMMPIYWLVICLMVNLFIHFFFSFYYHNFFIYSVVFSTSGVVKKDGSKWSFLKH